MAKTWARLYLGTRHHRKIRILRERHPGTWWIWYPLIEMAAEVNDMGWIYVSPGVPFADKELSKELGLPSKRALNSTLTTMKTLELIELESGLIKLCSFSDRQFESDSSTPRTRKFKGKHKHTENEGTKEERSGNVPGTPLTEQNRAEQNRAEHIPPTPSKRGARAAGLSLNKLGELWNQEAPNELPRVNLPFSRPPNDLKKLKAAVGRHPDLEWWRVIFQKLSSLPGLKGENDTGWNANFDFVVNKAELIIDGKYDGWGKGKGDRAW